MLFYGSPSIFLASEGAKGPALLTASTSTLISYTIRGRLQCESMPTQRGPRRINLGHSDGDLPIPSRLWILPSGCSNFSETLEP